MFSLQITSEGIVNVQWAFNEIIWHGAYSEVVDDYHMIRVKQFFGKFGPQAEKLSMKNIRISKSAILEVLDLMPNLLDLCVARCRIINDSGAHPTALEMSKLKTISLDHNVPGGISGFIDLIENISCPSIQSFFLKAGPLDLKFLSVFRNLQNIKIASSNNTDSEREIIIKSLDHLCQLKLTTLSLVGYLYDAPEVVALMIQSQPQLTSVTLSVQARAYQIDALRQIVKLQHLESLEIRIDFYTSGPEQLVRAMMQMPKLKNLEIVTSNRFNDDVIDEMFAAKNLQLESLGIRNLGKQKFHQLAIFFPNLKRLKVALRDLHGFARLMKLEVLHVLGTGCTELLEVNESVRELKADSSPFALVRLIREIPNIERIQIQKLYLDGATMEFFNELLSLKRLVEIECLDNEVLLDDGVIDCINNCAGSSKLQRIVFFLWDNWVPIVSAYEKSFPFKRVNYAKGTITLSRY